MPSYLATSLGFSLTKYALWTASIVVSMACGIWTFGQVADRVDQKPFFIVFQIGAVIMIYLYSRVTDPSKLLWMGAIMGMFVNGMLGSIGALMSEVYRIKGALLLAQKGCRL